MSLPREIALSPDQLEDMMLTTWNIRIATHGPGEHINLTPMWFGWAGSKVYMTARGQKVVNLRQNSNCTLLLDHNEKFPELMGIMMRATAKVLEDKATEDAAASCRSPGPDGCKIQRRSWGTTQRSSSSEQ